VKKILFIALVTLMLLAPPLHSKDVNISIEKLPSKRDIAGFLNSLERKISEENLFMKGNVTRDLIISTGNINENWLKDAIIKFYEENNIKWNETSVNNFIENLGMPENVKEAIALILYSYTNFIENNNLDSFLSLLNAIRTALPILQKYKMNETKMDNYEKIIFGSSMDDFYNCSRIFMIDFGGNDTYNEMNNSFILDIKGNDEYTDIKAVNGSNFLIDENGSDEYNNACYSYNGFSSLIDLGGDDFYNREICSSYENGTSFLLDMEGNDSYKGKNFTQCFSSNGKSILIDFEGDDFYSADEYSQASSIDGISILLDFSGDDKFFANKNSQAFASGGMIGKQTISLLINFAGDDYYGAGDYSQGYAGNMGFAALIDFIGNDVYNANKFSQASATVMGMAGLIDTDGVNKFSHGLFSQGYMLTGISFFMNNFEIKGNDKILEMINKLNLNPFQFFR